MTDKLLHSIAIPSSTQRDVGADGRRNLRTQGVLSEDSGQVNAVSTQPGQYDLNAVFSGKYVDLPVTAIEELFRASGFESVPFAARDPDVQTKEDGYYALGSINVTPLASQTNDGFRIDASLTKEGTINSHWRAIRTAPGEVDTPWGGNPGSEFAISQLASKVQWYDETNGTIATATPDRSAPTENGMVDIYDADAGPGDAPILLYELDYQNEYPTDCRVWDDYDRPKKLTQEADGSGSIVGSATVGTATVGGGESVLMPQWQRVFRTDHFFHGDPVVESGALRLIPDEVNNILRFYIWDDANQHWTLGQLGVSSWRLFDFDLTRISPETVEANLTFHDTSGSDYYTTHMVMMRGLRRARFLEPKNSGAMPSGVVDRLGPIARFQNYSAHERQTLIPRREVSH